MPTTENTPKVGDGATYTLWTDTHACTVVAVSPSGKKVTLQRDKAIVTNPELVRDAVESVKYRYEPDPEGETYVVTLRGNGTWKIVGQSAKTRGGYATFGERHEYIDPHF